MATLQEVVNSARFAELRNAGLTERIAAVLNAPEELSEPNPVESAPLVFNGSPTITDLRNVLTAAEIVAFARDDLKVTTLVDAAVAVDPANAAQANDMAATIIGFVSDVETYDASVWKVADASLRHNRPDIAQLLFGLIVLAGLMTQARADELGAAMLVPDPSWSDTITTWGQSEAEANGWGFVSVEQVKKAGTA